MLGIKEIYFFMPRESPFAIVLSKNERVALEAKARQYTSSYCDVIRAKIVLFAAEGLSNDIIATRLDTPRQIVSKWRKRFALARLPGLESQRQALEYGVKFAGCTVHFVDENLDAGPIVLQATVRVLDDDTEATLSARILAEEHRIYSEAVRIVLEGRYKIEGRRVIRTGYSAAEGALT